MPRRAAEEEFSAAMHIVFVHGAACGLRGLPPANCERRLPRHESCRTFLVCTVISPQLVEMTQNAANRGNLGQVGALKES
jgi:hypothetical protein